MEAGDLLGAKEIEELYDIVVECAGTESAVTEAVNLCRPAEKYQCSGLIGQGLSFPQTCRNDERDHDCSFLYVCSKRHGK